MSVISLEAFAKEAPIGVPGHRRPAEPAHIVTNDAEAIVIVERDAPGLTVIDDGSSFGQRTTGSGTVILENVRVPKTHVVPGYLGYAHPTADGPIFQIIQAAVDAQTVATAQIHVALAGTRSTVGVHNRDRHRRNARTHTLHDPVRWKYGILGNYSLNGVRPRAKASRF